jgi:hypothetical protein
MSGEDLLNEMEQFKKSVAEFQKTVGSLRHEAKLVLVLMGCVLVAEILLLFSILRR